MKTKSKEIPIFKSNNGFIEKIGSITISQDLEQDILNKEVSFSPVLEKILNNPKQIKTINLMPNEKIKLDSERKLINLIEKDCLEFIKKKQQALKENKEFRDEITNLYLKYLTKEVK